jgi:tetratricopeptide (TPR) repeat protein/SAM-dependent methyltransferase
MNNSPLKEEQAASARIYTLKQHDADAWYALSHTHWSSGNIDEARNCCLRALELQPDHFDAIVGLGNVLFSLGQQEKAALQYQKALQINPEHAVAHCNLGNILSVMGRYDSAAASYQKAIQIDPNLFIAFYNFGNLRMQQCAYDKAVNNFKRAVALIPSEEQLTVIKHQGRLLAQNNRPEEAKALFTQLCQTYPDDTQSWLHLSTVNGKLGNIDEAGDCCRRVLAIQPHHDQAHVVLGNVFFHHRKLDEALSHYQRALESNPQNVTALNNFGNACQTEEQIHDYIGFYREAIKLLSDPSEARATFGKIIKNTLPTAYVPWLDEELQECFSNRAFDDKYLSRVTSHLLRLKYDIQVSSGHDNREWRMSGGNIAPDKLFILFLKNTVNTDATLEQYLITLRRDLLKKYVSGNTLGNDDLQVIGALAHQSYNNEYVFSLETLEEQIIDDLRHSIEHRVPALQEPDRDLECRLLVFAMYENLYSLACKKDLCLMPQASWSGIMHPLLEQTILNPLEEEAIKQEIVSVGRIEDKTSRLVQSQYEENPYPRWLSVPRDRSRNLKLVVKQLFPDFTPPSFLDGPIQMLIAGCGTGKHPIQTASYGNVEITAIDISKSSLAYGMRMARKYGVTNVKFMQGDILQLAKLDKRFHIIESVGVLHHMEDPLAGWRILSDLLVEGGLMSIGLYSELARKPIVAAQEVIRNEGLIPDRSNIRNFRKRILQRDLDDAICGLSNVNDFYSSSECRDLLFHSTEHRYTLPQIGKALNDLKLDFLGFVFDSLKTPGMYREHFPVDRNMKNLLLWDKYEKLYPNTFTGMYKFWCQKY